MLNSLAKEHEEYWLLFLVHTFPNMDLVKEYEEYSNCLVSAFSFPKKAIVVVSVTMKLHLFTK